MKNNNVKLKIRFEKKSFSIFLIVILIFDIYILILNNTNLSEL